MNNTTKNIFNSSRRCLTVFVAAMGLAGLLSVPVQAHETLNDHNEVQNHAVSANAAKRLVRKFLNEAGYTRSLKTGGAQIKKVTMEDGYYSVKVLLRNNGSTNPNRGNVYVNANTGLLTYSPQQSASDATRIADVSAGSSSKVATGK